MSNYGILSYRAAVVTSEAEFLFKELRSGGCYQAAMRMRLLY